MACRFTYRGKVYDEDGLAKALAEMPLEDAAKFIPNVSPLPDAPFKESWETLVMKRMVRWAAEKGFDEIAWTPGQVQKARYNLAKQVQAIYLTPLRRVEDKKLTGYQFEAISHGGGHVINQKLPVDKIEEKLTDLVGKEPTERLLTGENKNRLDNGQAAYLTGLDLEVGGKWTHQVYDKKLVDIANKLGKKFGTKVGTTTLTGKDEITRDAYGPRRRSPPPWTVHSMPIPEAMRDAVMQGQTQFTLRRKGEQDATGREGAAEGDTGATTAGAEAREISGRGELSRGAGRVASPVRAGTEIPLDGLPRKITIPGHGTITAGPFAKARQAARDYTSKAGIDYNPPTDYVKVDPERARRVAQAYEDMKHAPNDPEVKRAYKAMIDETVAQWKAIEATGLDIDWIKDNKDPYEMSPRLATEDVRNNNHLWVFPTEGGFGLDVGVGADASQHPLLADTGITIKGHKLVANDVFRIVHDYFGHVKEGVGFRADGEENAWRSHAAMYSPEARRAMTVETRGQNSWVNWGPYGDNNRTAKSANTRYGDQKAGLLPDWVVSEGSGQEQFTQRKRKPEPKPPSMMSFVSPSVVDQTYRGAAARLKYSLQQQAITDAAKEIDALVGIRNKARGGVGVWRDGAENILITEAVSRKTTADQFKLAAAMKGLLANQKQVLIFYPAVDGASALAKFTLKGNMAKVHARLNEAGIERHSLEQIKNGVIRVYVYLENQSDIEQIEALKPIKPSYDRGRGEFIGSTDKTKNASADEQRKEARRDYRNIIKTLGVSAALEGHDFAVDWEVLLDAWRKRLRDAEPQIQPPLKGLKKGSHPQRISQGVTSTNLKQVDSDEHFVRTTIDEMKSAGVDPATPARPATRAKPAQPAQPARDRFEYNMHLFRDAHAYPGMLASELTGTPAEIAEKVKARIKDNLRWFWNKATAAQQGGRKWYRGAHNLAKAWAKEFDLDLASVVGTLAALSPQKDWDTNIYLARQAIRIFKTKQDFLWSKEMEKTARRIWRDAKTGKPRTEVLVALRGTRLSDLHDAKQIGDWIRTYEETYGDPDQPLVDGSTYEHQHGYRIYNPDGTFGDYVRNVSTGGKPGQLSKAAWNTRSANESAIMALTSQGDRRLISQAMGEVHKVRQFYNDILDPEHHDGKYDDDVVIDTHAIGAAWVRPLSGTGSAAVAHGLATSPDPKKMHRVPNFRPALDDPKRGQYGLYPVYAEAYRELAKELSKELGVTILPHQVQAVVWTVKRDLFEDISDSAVVRINRAWDVFHRGKRSLGATRELVWQIAELNNAAARRKKRSE